MGIVKIKKGLDLPITGEPKQVISEGNPVKSVAILGEDYIGMKPTMLVQEGDTVKTGQVVFTDKKSHGVKYTAPGAGKVVSINRGEKRVFLSMIIELQGNEEVTFASFSEGEIKSLDTEKIKEQLIESGMWTALRTRPFSKVANPKKAPHSIFVNAMDSNPLAPDVSKILEGKEQNFKTGLEILGKLTEGKVYVSKAPGAKIPAENGGQVSVEEFDGPHPAGLPGTHIHFLDPVSRSKTVWYLDAQDVVAIGSLFTTGKLYTERVVSLAGPQVKEPRLVKTRLGASLTDITAGELADDENRLISGSVLSGRKYNEVTGFLGRYHQSVSVIKEDTDRVFVGWMTPGMTLYSIKNIVASKLFPKKKFAFTTAKHGGHRAIVPIGSYEDVMPLDILPTFLLRSLAVDDLEEAEKLGILELDEEDLALCTFADPSKHDFGPILRRNLNTIEKEG